MARITVLDAMVTGAQPVEEFVGPRRYRPSIDLERVRLSWDRAHRHFSARQAHDAETQRAAYAPGAVIYDMLLGELEGPQIGRAINGFRRQSADHAMQFQVESAAAGAAKVNWIQSYIFLPTGRRIQIEGTTRMLFGQHGIERQIESTDRFVWSRQAFGAKALVLAWLPGWRSFLEAELRLAYAVDGDGR